MSQDSLEMLQRLVDDYVGDVQTVLSALSDESTPADARAPLVAVLNYVLDLLDIFPDHYQGLGVVDDAMLLRLGAKHAVAKGATGEALKSLAAQADTVATIAGDLAAPFEAYVGKLEARTVRSRTVSQILSDKAVFSAFTHDVSRQISSSAPQPIPPNTDGTWAIGELRRMMKHALKKEGLVS